MLIRAVQPTSGTYLSIVGLCVMKQRVTGNPESETKKRNGNLTMEQDAY